MNIEDWKSQIRRGTLEFCILLLMEKKPRYGYELISILEKWPIVAAKESTIYPLLRRLLKEECLTSFWQETTEGLPPRKYYSITEKGREYLAAMSAEWENLLLTIEAMKKPDENLLKEDIIINNVPQNKRTVSETERKKKNGWTGS